MNTRRRSNNTALVLVLGVLPLALALMPAGGCSSVSELCDLQCECTHCNDWEEDQCVISGDEQADIASAYDCDVEFDKYVECALNNNSCDEGDNDFEIDEDCQDDLQDLYECIDDASDYGSSQQGPGPGQGPATGVGGSTTTATGVGGGGGACASCSEAASDTTGTITLADTCGAETGCGTATSCGLATALLSCTCASCPNECQLTCTMSGADMPDCQTCAQTNCPNEVAACFADTGGG